MISPQTTLTLALTLVQLSIGFNYVVGFVYYTRNGIISTITLWASFFYIITAFFGALITWPLSTYLRFGRRPTVLAALLLSTLACILEISGTQTAWATLIAGRFIESFAAGMLTVLTLLWQVEVAAAASRGRRVAILYTGAAVGTALGTWMTYAVSFANSNTTSSQIALGLQFIGLAIAGIATFFANESWRWALSKNQTDRARHLFTVFHPHLSISAIESRFETARFHAHQTVATKGLRISGHQSSKGGSSLHAYRRLSLAILLQLATSLSGIQVADLFYLGSSVISLFPTKNPNGVNLVRTFIPTLFALFTLLPLPFIDSTNRFLGGRRKLLIVSFLGLAFCFLIPLVTAATTSNPFITFSSSAYSSNTNLDTPLLHTVFAFFLLATLFFAVGANFIPLLYAAEIAASPHSSTRSASVAITVAVGYALSVADVWINTTTSGELGWKGWGIWVVLDVFWATMVYLFVPEMGGRALEGIDSPFARGEVGRKVWRETRWRRVEMGGEEWMDGRGEMDVCGDQFEMDAMGRGTERSEVDGKGVEAAAEMAGWRYQRQGDVELDAAETRRSQPKELASPDSVVVLDRVVRKQ